MSGSDPGLTAFQWVRAVVGLVIALVLILIGVSRPREAPQKGLPGWGYVAAGGLVAGLTVLAIRPGPLAAVSSAILLALPLVPP